MGDASGQGKLRVPAPRLSVAVSKPQTDPHAPLQLMEVGLEERLMQNYGQQWRELSKITGCLSATITALCGASSGETFLFPASHSREISTIVRKLKLLLEGWNAAGCPELLGSDVLSQHLVTEEYVCAIFERWLTLEEAFAGQDDGEQWWDCDASVGKLVRKSACRRETLRACSKVSRDDLCSCSVFPSSLTCSLLFSPWVFSVNLYGIAVRRTRNSRGGRTAPCAFRRSGSCRK